MAPSRAPAPLSRDAVHALIDLHRQLRQRGITPPPLGANTTAELLDVAAVVDDAMIQACRQRVLAALTSNPSSVTAAVPTTHPPSQPVRAPSDREDKRSATPPAAPIPKKLMPTTARAGFLTCEYCAYVHRVKLVDLQQAEYPLPVVCPCGATYHVTLDRRRSARKHTSLRGTYYSEGEKKGPMIVEDISFGGMSIRLLTPHQLTRHARLHLNFTLDDVGGTVIDVQVRVRSVRGQTLGVQFVNVPPIPHALAVYLLA
jgi:PilZ domain